MKIISRLCWFAVAVLCLVFFAYKSLLSYCNTPLDSLDSPYDYLVRSGASLSHILEELTARGVWTSATLVRACASVSNPGFVLKAGEYRIMPGTSPAEILETFDRGVSLQYSVTFIEGETARQMLARMDMFDEPDLSLPTGDEDQAGYLSAMLADDAVQIMQGNRHAEGWFFPDTYYYDKTDKLADVLLRAHLKMLGVLRAEWLKRDQGLPYGSVYEALVMASLIERETGVVHEREQIAGVFVRRLQQNMRLQTDPSVIYGMGTGFSGNLRRADLRSDGPYNTYTRHGLPPTPIAMPGLAAIRAALHPAEGDTLYFVAKGDGSHYFSRTLEEHQRAVHKYQILNRRADYRSSPN